MDLRNAMVPGFEPSIPYFDGGFFGILTRFWAVLGGPKGPLFINTWWFCPKKLCNIGVNHPPNRVFDLNFWGF